MKTKIKETIKIVNDHLQVVLSPLFVIVYLCLLIILCNTAFNITMNLLRVGDRNGIPRDVIQEYNYLKSILDKPSAKKKTVTDGFSEGFEDSEWPVMTLSLTSYAMSNLVVKDPSLKEEVSGYLKKAIDRVMLPEYYHFTVDHYGDPFKGEKIGDNAFYLGHFILMLAVYRDVSGEGDYDELFHRLALGFYENFKNSPTRCLTSYTDMTWTSEQVVPFRALKIHDDIFGTNYKEVIYEWRDIMEEKFIPEETGILITMLDKDSGFILQGERTIPNAWTIMFLYDILPDFCRSLYQNMKKELMITRLGFPMFKEWVGEEQHVTGDTGPIIWDAAVSSTAFGIASAAVMGDDEVFYPVRGLADVLALAVSFNGKRKYLLGGQIGTTGMFLVKTMALVRENTPGRTPVKNIVFIYGFIIAIGALVFWGFRINFIKAKQLLKLKRQK